jgi:hypothetical protein
MQLSIAMHYRFIVVPEFLIGYRDVPGNMSSDGVRMMRSQILAFDIIAARCAALPKIPFRLIRLRHRTILLILLLRSKRYRDLLGELNFARAKDASIIILLPLFAFIVLGRATRWSVRKVWDTIMGEPRVRIPRRFLEFTVDECRGARLPRTVALALIMLWMFDRCCAGGNGYFPSAGRC